MRTHNERLRTRCGYDDTDPFEDDDDDKELYETGQLDGQAAPGRWIALIALIVVLVGSRILPLR